MALEGTLQDMSLSDLFQVFRMGPKTGVLLLIGSSERGVIYVAEGRLIDAAVVRGADRSVVAVQDEAVLHTLLWEQASFVFRHDEAVTNRRARIVHDAEWLVMESMRRRKDPTRALPYHKLTLETQLQLSPLPSSAESGVSLDVNQWRILSQVASCPNLRTVCAATGIEPEQAIRTVAELLSIGLVEIVPPAPPAPKPQSELRYPAQAGVAPLRRMEPALAGASLPALNSTVERGEAMGRGLLDAIMRRIRGL